MKSRIRGSEVSVPDCLKQEIQKGNSLGGATLLSSHGSAHKAVQPRPNLAGGRIPRGRSVPGDLDGYRVRWFTKNEPIFAYTVIASGALMGLSLALQIGISLYEMWFAPREIDAQL